MAVKNSNIVLYRNSVALDKGLRLVKSREKEKALEESNQIPYGGIMVIVQYGGTRYVKITDGAKTFSEIPKDGEGGSGGGDASTLNGQNGAYYRNRANHTGTQAQSTITGLSTALAAKANTADLGDLATEDSVDYDTQVSGKPSSFPPSAHTHAAADVTSGAFDAARIPNLNASKINAGTFDAARIPTLDQSKVSNLTSDLAGKQATLSVPSQSEAESGTATTARSWTAQRDRQGIIGASRIIVSVSGSKTLVLTDEYTFQNVTAASTITIPDNASVAFPIGAEITVALESGTATIAAASGVTTVSLNNNLSLDTVGQVAVLKKTGTDKWFIGINGGA